MAWVGGSEHETAPATQSEPAHVTATQQSSHQVKNIRAAPHARRATRLSPFTHLHGLLVGLHRTAADAVAVRAGPLRQRQRLSRGQAVGQAEQRGAHAAAAPVAVPAVQVQVLARAHEAEQAKGEGGSLWSGVVRGTGAGRVGGKGRRQARRRHA